MTLSRVVKLYWDSCAWIGLINGEANKKRELEIVYSNAKNGLCQIWTSTLAFVEVNRFEDEHGKPKPLERDKGEVIGNLFRQTFVKPIPMDVEIAHRARDLTRETVGLGKFKDAVHLASALRWDIPIMHTYDRVDLLHLSGKFTCKSGSRLEICYPDETTDGPLFAQAKQPA
jgi:predicted nucleic acid-binding protein